MARLSTRTEPKQKTPARFSEEYGVLLDLLVELRLQAEVTQQRMAEHLGTSQSHISLWERKEREISVVDIWRWCNATGISISKFFTLFEQRLAKIQKQDQ